MSAEDSAPEDSSASQAAAAHEDGLARRVARLETELETEREERQALEELITKLGERYRHLLEDIIELEDRVDDQSRHTGAQKPPDTALPIMRLSWSAEAAPESLKPNEQRAAVVWRSFFEACSRTPTKYVLDSTTVGTILTGHDGSAPYRTTVRRVMELIAEHGEDYIELTTVDGRNALVIDRQPFDRYVEELSEEALA